MEIIAFLNQKGGVGKTTSAVNIGAILAGEHHRKVLLIDLDPQGNLSDHLGLYPAEGEKSIYDVLIDGTPVAAVMKHAYDMDVLPANIDLSGAEAELVTMLSRETRLKRAVGDICRNYDYVFLDCPPSLGLLTICGLTLAHTVIVPMEAEYLALKGLSQLSNTLGLVRENLNSELEIGGVLFCMYNGNSNLARNVKKEVETYFPDKVFETCIRRNIRLAEAPSHGMPVNVYDCCCAGADDYRLVAEEIIARYEEGEAKKKIVPRPADPLPKTPSMTAPDPAEDFSRPAATEAALPAAPDITAEEVSVPEVSPDFPPLADELPAGREILAAESRASAAEKSSNMSYDISGEDENSVTAGNVPEKIAVTSPVPSPAVTATMSYDLTAEDDNFEIAASSPGNATADTAVSSPLTVTFPQPAGGFSPQIPGQVYLRHAAAPRQPFHGLPPFWKGDTDTQ